MSSIMIRQNEEGLWEEYKPYTTIAIETEEDFERLQKALETFKSIKPFMKALHDLGGTDAKDEYSRGWDEAINMALGLAGGTFGIGLEECLTSEVE